MLTEVVLYILLFDCVDDVFNINTEVRVTRSAKPNLLFNYPIGEQRELKATLLAINDADHVWIRGIKLTYRIRLYFQTGNLNKLFKNS